ncbi:MAG TPA: molybdenum cofactor biosynthesis protein MoaE [Gemmatimonadales bacterium]|nr:molybdenum cofactor biosynthesis protein MoaE [Gemmatimonadales bacterium]
MSYLTGEPIDLTALASRVESAERGGVVTFVGHVRNHHGGRGVRRLEYSAYAPMAEAECQAIVREAELRWPVTVELRHRTGRLDVGDVAVAIAVAGNHRGEAFDACRWIIDEVKRRVPIWKREYYTDGSVAWVDPTAAGGTVPAAEPAEGPGAR